MLRVLYPALSGMRPHQPRIDSGGGCGGGACVGVVPTDPAGLPLPVTNAGQQLPGGWPPAASASAQRCPAPVPPSARSSTV